MSSRWVEITWPEDFLGRGAEFLERAGLHYRGDRRSRRLAVTTTAQYRRTDERLIKVDAAIPLSDGLASVATAVERWPLRRPDVNDPAVSEEMARLLHRDQVNLANLMEAGQLGMLCCPHDDLPTFVTNSLLSPVLEAFPASWAIVADLNDTLYVRAAFIRGMFTAESAPEWYQSREFGFEAMRGLSGGLFQGGSVVLDPLLAVLFPYVFGGCLLRIPVGMLAVGFGEPVTYREGLRDNDLRGLFQGDLLTHGAGVKVPATPLHAPNTYPTAVEWWLRQASTVLSTVLDPTLFSADDGKYLPSVHHGYTHAIERLFTSVLRCLMMTGSDEYTRRIHLFEVLDLVDGLRLGNYDRTLSADLLSQHLVHLRLILPGEVAALVMPRCEAAVDALGSMQHGFAPSTCAAGLVSMPRRAVPADVAVARYLRKIRNGSHGLVSDMEDDETRRILAMHDGAIPPEVSDLALLHLVRLMAEPELLAEPWLRRLARRGRT